MQKTMVKAVSIFMLVFFVMAMTAAAACPNVASKTTSPTCKTCDASKTCKTCSACKNCSTCKSKGCSTCKNCTKCKKSVLVKKNGKWVKVSKCKCPSCKCTSCKK